MTSNNGFSIIVCTYNGNRTLAKVVSHINLLSTINFNFELIIVDNNSNTESYSLIKNLIKEYDSVDIIYLKEIKIGKTHALIKGFEYANYEYIIICDDDNYLHHDYLIYAYDILKNHKDVGIIGGLSTLSNQMNLPFWFEKYKAAWALGPQQLQNGYIDTKFPSVWGAGMVIRKSIWHDIKKLGFKSFLTGRIENNVSMAGEDTELCTLANYLGYRIYYSDNLKITHDVNSNRLNWSHYLELNEGFSRSQVYFELYDLVFANENNLGFKNEIWKKHISKYIKLFFYDCRHLYFYKGLFLGFIKKNEGYEYGIVKRTNLTKIIELFRIRNKYSIYLESLAFIHNVKK